jgi:hypothetical protein
MKMDKVIEVLKLLNECGEGLNYLSPAGRMNHIKATQALNQAQAAKKVIEAVGKRIQAAENKDSDGYIRAEAEEIKAYNEYKSLSEKGG